jgi:hypothetical protein
LESCACGGVADNKTISKWLRDRRNLTPLKAFLAETGGTRAPTDMRSILNRPGR